MCIELVNGVRPKLHTALESKLEAILVALAVAGAFDKGWWKDLLVKLQTWGCRGKALALLRSYSKDRFVYVVATWIRSVLKQFFCGVPQGGIWSPKLWNSYSQDPVLCSVRSE